MRNNKSLLSFLYVGILISCFIVYPSFAGQSEKILIRSHEQEKSEAYIQTATVAGEKVIAVMFEGTDDLHYYADEETAVGGMALAIEALADGLEFGVLDYPHYEEFYDAAQEMNVSVYVGNFNVYIPITSIPEGAGEKEVKVLISGVVCTSEICLRPFDYELTLKADFANAEDWPVLPEHKAEAADTADKAGGKEKIPVDIGKLTIYLLLAVVAGFTFNLMPCVLPVIPLIITRLLRQAEESRPRSIALGIGFCGGIILFFLIFAVISIVFQVITGSVFNWSDQFRYPSFIIGMSLFILVFALFMFDVFTIAIPSSIASKSGQGTGLGGSIGMGFLAALLSTPCTGALIGFVLVWVQTQTAIVAVLTFALMGAGMALPYAFLVAFPSLLNSLPKPGKWMENLRKAMGFILLIIAVKIIGALPKDQLVHALYYAVILSFAVWMWGSWVNFMTPTRKKLTVRAVALILAIGMGLVLLPVYEDKVDWQSYDQITINRAQSGGQPVLIKFTADWCANCVVVDKRVYKDSEVANLIEEKGVLAIKADTTLADYPATIGLREVYGEPGNVPVTIYLDPEGNEHKLRGIFKKKDLVDLLEKLEDADN